MRGVMRGISSTGRPRQNFSKVRLLEVLRALVDRGHSLVVIEHNLDVLKSADWILEVGPEAGDAGGRIVAEGPPEAIARAGVATSPFLRAALEEGSAGQPDPGAAAIGRASCRERV